MRIGIIIFVVIILIISGILVYVYFKVEKPKHDETLQYVDLSIFAREIGLQVYNETGYKLYSNGLFLSEGKTAKYGGVLEKIPLNKTILITSFNLENQDYYIYNKTFETSENKTYRVDLDLVKPGNLSFEQVGIFSNNEFLYLNATAIGENRGLYYCITWSKHIIFANSILDTRVVRNDSLIKCYDFGNLQNGSKKEIRIEYKKFGIIDKDDFILLKFYDFEDKLRTIYNLNNCDETCYY
jgi:hypothetical protein